MSLAKFGHIKLRERAHCNDLTARLNPPLAVGRQGGHLVGVDVGLGVFGRQRLVDGRLVLIRPGSHAQQGVGKPSPGFAEAVLDLTAVDALSFNKAVTDQRF